MKFIHRQHFNKPRTAFWRNHEQAIGFSLIACQLCEELVVADAGRGRQTGHLLDLGMDFLGDCCRDVDTLVVFGYIEVGPVE